MNYQQSLNLNLDQSTSFTINSTCSLVSLIGILITMCSRWFTYMLKLSMSLIALPLSHPSMIAGLHWYSKANIHMKTSQLYDTPSRIWLMLAMVCTSYLSLLIVMITSLFWPMNILNTSIHIDYSELSHPMLNLSVCPSAMPAEIETLRILLLFWK